MDLYSIYYDIANNVQHDCSYGKIEIENIPIANTQVLHRDSFYAEELY